MAERNWKVENKREKIINGLRLLHEECSKTTPNKCGTKCLYNDICDIVNQREMPDMWNIGKLKDSAK